MSKRGGYAILDLNDMPLTFGATASVKIPGITAATAAAYVSRRAVLVSGLTAAEEADGAATAYPDSFGAVSPGATAGTYTVRFSAAGKTALLHVDGSDGVIAEVG